MRTDPFVDSSLRSDIELLLWDLRLKPETQQALLRLRDKTLTAPHTDNLTAAEVAWVGSLIASLTAIDATTRGLGWIR